MIWCRISSHLFYFQLINFNNVIDDVLKSVILSYQLLMMFIGFGYIVCHMQVCHRYHMSTGCFDKFQSIICDVLISILHELSMLAIHIINISFISCQIIYFFFIRLFRYTLLVDFLSKASYSDCTVLIVEFSNNFVITYTERKLW